MKRFELRVKLFAIENRRDGKTWGEIRRAIKTEFLIDPPTVRAMQKWEKELDRQGLTRAIEQKAKEEAETAKNQVVNSLVRDLVPKLLEVSRVSGNIESVSWKYFFSVMESMLGRDKLRMIAANYLEESKE